uniref:Uncharacterized protein n=1 Tax=Neisseria meningitidis alpha275 TaxID=295996 RepID=C6SMN8_NEIME|nr:hypothetical protein predicted by Glimmer/Critica [Neisseria meningitidis alpha275]
MSLFGGNRLGVEFLFQKPEESFKKIDVESVCLFDDSRISSSTTLTNAIGR